MANMVCNCDSVANIDYGIPLDYTTPDYRTSTLVGLRYHPSVRQEFYVSKNFLAIFLCI